MSVQWMEEGPLHKAVLYKGFITLYVVQMSRDSEGIAEYMVRVNGVEVKRYPKELGEAKELAVNAAKKLMNMALQQLA